jgi:hypothetical protein
MLAEARVQMTVDEVCIENIVSMVLKGPMAFHRSVPFMYIGISRPEQDAISPSPSCIALTPGWLPAFGMTVVLTVLVGGYYGIRALVTDHGTALTASGTIEAGEVAIAPEISGKVIEVPVGRARRSRPVTSCFVWMTAC